MRYTQAPTPYVEFNQLSKESQQNALADISTLTYLARMKKTTREKITEKNVMKHIVFNDFRFTLDGRGKKRHA